ncbi:MAG TPA: ROK family protein, partial [Vicinamibacterales bacterium]|nr:ROK family protein [Vicinamibacterales bacterium]
MRSAPPPHLRVATRGTTRAINRQIALNLIRTNQPISRADLARLMGTRRGAVSLLVSQLIADGDVYEGATGEARRGRKPTFLYIDSRKRCVVAVDIRTTRTLVMVTDLVGQQLASVTSFPTERDPKRFVAGLVKRVKAILLEHKDLGRCQGVGVVVPGMVEAESGRVLRAPNLGWRDLNLRDPIAAALGLPVQIENSGKACALAELWAARGGQGHRNFIFVTVSDGLGIGVVLGGELVRGQHNIAGEFGHVPLNVDGPRCGCGATGCWEAYVSNLATLSRYFGRDLRTPSAATLPSITIDDLIVRARSGGDAKALAALLATARYL